MSGGRLREAGVGEGRGRERDAAEMNAALEGQQ